MINEIWKDIKGYEGLYQVSNMGRIKSIPIIKKNNRCEFATKEIIRKNQLTSKCYERIMLKKDGTKKSFMVHRLVAEAFIPNPENKPQVDHINAIRNDNRVKNLRWVTHKENMNNPLTKKKRSKAFSGEKNPFYNRTHSEETRRKMSEVRKGVFAGNKNPRARKVVCITTNMIFDTTKEAGEYYHINNSTIVRCCKGKVKSAGKLEDGTKLVWQYI